MKSQGKPGREAIISKGWFRAHQWLISRRFSQLFILMLFLAGPWFGWWIVTGNLSSSLTLGTLPLSDPFVLLQAIAAGHWPETAAITGAVIVVVFYLLVGGRVYCSWVCPVNLVTDAAFWLRQRLGIGGASSLSRKTRYWLLAAILLVSIVSGSIAWEMVNPVSMLHRGLIFGIGFAWIVVSAVFVFDLLVTRRGWCSHLCPMGAFYSLLGTRSLIRVRADNRSACNDCMDCYLVCPEQQVIRPALKGADKGIGPVIDSANCTNCGRCIDVCAPNVFHFGLRFNNQNSIGSADANHSSHSSGVEIS
ncbi:MAG: quinol dehydrogenase ferredoxin subunit NapH [Gammaproteobacteria bacterium]|nr:MAG: quinol dehydrogenase ferredoxin subunit NapH [Gammaproteobacteria bacterium]